MRLVLAVALSASVVAQPDPLVVYAWADQATAASYTPSAAYAFNPHGTVTASRTSAGDYAIDFQGFGAFASDEAGAQGHVQVSAYKSDATCTVDGWSGDRVRVRCSDPSGARVDSRYTVLWVKPGGAPGQIGFAWASRATATDDYLPPAAYAYNGAGRVLTPPFRDVEVRPSVAGRAVVAYTDMLDYLSTDPGGAGAALVTAYGSDLGCQVRSFIPGSTEYRATVECTGPTGARAASAFTTLAMFPGATLGLVAYSRVDDPTAPTSTPDALSTLNPGGATAVRRVGTGDYRVTFSGLQALAPSGARGTVQVSPYGSTTARCSVESWSGTSDLEVRVQCRAPGGAPVDARAQVVVLYGQPPSDAPPPTAQFDDRTPGEIIVSGLGEVGIRFPNGVEVLDCTARTFACTNAASSDLVVAPQPTTEFDRAPFEARFARPQQAVSLAVNGFAQDGRTHRVELRAYNDSGAEVRVDIAEFKSGPGWPARLSVAANGPEIRRVRLFVYREGVETNDVLVDDMWISDSTPSTPDTEAPFINLRLLGVNDSNPRPIRVEVTENLELARVTASATYEPTGEEVFAVDGYTGDLCGGAVGACPAREFEPLIRIPTGRDGRYVVTVTAVDQAGNERIRGVAFEFEAPPPAPTVFAWRVEINQGVADGLQPAFRDAASGVPLVLGKPTLVRYYLMHRGDAEAVVRQATGRLTVRTVLRDGTAREQGIAPNVDGRVDVYAAPPLGARPDTTLWMRTTLDRTLDFVIPADWTSDPDIESVELRLFSPAQAENLSVIQTEALRRSVVGLNLYRLSNPTLNGDDGTPTQDEIDDRVLAYMRNAMPVSEVRVLRTRLLYFRWEPTGEEIIDCLRVLRTFWWGIDGSRDGMPDDAPGWVTNLLVGRSVGGGCSGIAYLGDPSDSGDRNYDSYATTVLRGDTGTHEVMHTIGFTHASNAHGEDGGGGSEPWPYPHGLLSFGDTGFGAAIRPRTAPTETDAGTWAVTIVDPCPGVTLAERADCPLPDASDTEFGPSHELMSYGPSSGGLIPYVTNGNRWLSDRNSRRVDQAIRFGTRPTTREPARAPVMAFLVSAEVAPDGTGGFGPFMARPVRADLVQDQPTGPFTLDLFDENDVRLSRTSLEATEVADGDRATWTHLRAYVPFVEGVRRARLRLDGAAVAEMTASATAPTVRVLAPNGGESVPSGLTTVRWQAGDADGDPLTVVVQYSPDGGLTWEGLAVLTGDDPPEVEVLVDELTAGAEGVIRVVVSDGLLTASDRSDAAFAFGDVVVPIDDPVVPTAFGIASARPNPFAQSTEIIYTLPTPSDVRVEVFDVVGRRVAVLAEGRVGVGEHRAIFDAGQLPSGTYLVRVTANGRTATTLVSLVR